MTRSTAPRRQRRRQAGFSMLELLIGGSVLAVALLGHTASIFSEHRLSESERTRSAALLAAEQFMECMRSDDDFAGLFRRLNTLQEMGRRSPTAGETWLKAQMAAGPVGLTLGNLQAARTDFVPLADGRRAFHPNAYYEDYRTPRALRTFHVAVAVPTAAPATNPLGDNVLREDLPLSPFGLPADIDGDGVVDDARRDDDYRTLPVVVTFRWTTSAGAQEELDLATWLWGYR